MMVQLWCKSKYYCTKMDANSVQSENNLYTDEK